ncbi:MAG TPA: acireductone synthase [Pyrinomonadaceae bacterium]|nr:acireductone synthase [Pyrinomonadaceae bacterium]
MTESLSSVGIRGILLDIEGTTTPIAFVHDVLFTYAREHVRNFLVQHANELGDDVALLREEHARDTGSGAQPPPLTDDPATIANYVHWLIDRDRKSTGLKSLQGKIWREGYTSGTLKAQVFSDVRPAFERWQNAGLQISIFSSGSVLAQQLLFAHTEVGDLTPFIHDYFDTNVGAKGDAESYRRIATNMSLAPHEILFISDVVTELEAASTAQMKTRLSIRPGNQPQPNPDRFHIIHSLDEV